MKKIRPEPATAGRITQARLSPDGDRIAFVVDDAADAGIYVGEAGADRFDKVVGYASFCTPEIAWSSDGRHLAYRIVGDPAGYYDQVGYVRTNERGEVMRFDGQAFAWARKGSVLYVLDGARMALLRYDLDKGSSRQIGEFFHHYDERFSPRLVPAPDGSRIAFTSRNALENTTRLFIAERRGGEVGSHPLTWIPGADVHVLPFWSPKGRSLGLHMVHEGLDTTGLVLVKNLEGEGEIYYQREALDEPVTPAWTPDGEAIVLRRQEGWARLDLADRSLHDLAIDGKGAPRFLVPSQLAIEGGAEVVVASWPP